MGPFGPRQATESVRLQGHPCPWTQCSPICTPGSGPAPQVCSGAPQGQPGAAHQPRSPAALGRFPVDPRWDAGGAARHHGAAVRWLLFLLQPAPGTAPKATTGSERPLLQASWWRRSSSWWKPAPRPGGDSGTPPVMGTISPALRALLPGSASESLDPRDDPEGFGAALLVRVCLGQSAGEFPRMGRQGGGWRPEAALNLKLSPDL